MTSDNMQYVWGLAAVSVAFVVVRGLWRLAANSAALYIVGAIVGALIFTLLVGPIMAPLGPFGALVFYLMLRDSSKSGPLP